MPRLAEDEDYKRVLLDLWFVMTPDERAAVLAQTPIDKFLATIPLEQRLKGLTPEELERLRQLLQ